MVIDPDLALVVGLALVLLSSLSFAAAWVDRRRPWMGGVICALGLALVVLALRASPQPFTPSGLPTTIYTVIGRYLP